MLTYNDAFIYTETVPPGAAQQVMGLLGTTTIRNTIPPTFRFDKNQMLSNSLDVPALFADPFGGALTPVDESDYAPFPFISSALVQVFSTTTAHVTYTLTPQRE